MALGQMFKVGSCKRCARTVLVGWVDGLFEIQLELTPLTPAQELLVTLAGTMCYSAVPRHGTERLQIAWRDVTSIQADARRPRPMVLPEHVCPRLAR